MMAKRATTIAISFNQTARLLAVAAFVVFLLATVTAMSRAAKAAGSFDGAWKVTIITQSGNCDPAYSYPVKVVAGRVSYSGDGSFDISGQVGEAGSVSVSIERGDQKASATGKLSASSGSGHWSGKSSSTACSGRWEATRNS